MSRRLLLRQLSALVVALLSILSQYSRAQNTRVSAGDADAAGGEPKRPNILLIMADDLGHEKLGCYGGTSYPTPELDELARQGIRFTRCYANPLCTPSRVKIMTGRYLFRSYEGFGRFPEGEISFGQVLKDAGYATCLAGKWQLGGRQRPSDLGFDEYAIHAGSKHWGTSFKTNQGKVRQADTEYAADYCCRFLCDFMEKNRGRPFFAYHPMFLVHAPIGPTPESDTPGEDDYGDMVKYMDKTVGKLVDKLNELGIRDNTLILFTGDNGSARRSELRGQVVRAGKGSMRDQGTHVPLIANWRGTTHAGRVCDDLVDFSDFLPTLAQAAKARLPRDRVIDGYSFFPQLLGRKGNPRRWAFVHHWRSGRDPDTQYRWARDKHYKLYHVVKAGSPKVARLDGMLFHTLADPDEKAPIPADDGDAEADAARKKLRRVLDTIECHGTPPLPSLSGTASGNMAWPEEAE